MSQVPWTDLKKAPLRTHLIVGMVPADALAATPSELELRVDLLARLARHLRLRGTYAIAFQEGIAREVHCIFEQLEDAVALANALDATESADHPDYESHRSFRCDNSAAAAIEARLREETDVQRGG